MSAKSHPLFEAYPLNGEAVISVGRVPIPYHTYDGVGLLIGGTADFDYIHGLLQTENVHPIRTVEGRALMGIWVVDFTEASLGAHNELQFSILVSHQPVPAVESHPLTLLKALFGNPQARMFCYGLWNNTEIVVAYNRELLGLNAQPCRGSIQNRDGQRTFRFTDQNGHRIVEGQVGTHRRTSPRVGWALFRLLGLRKTLQAISQPYLGAKVVNPISDLFPYNGDAQTYIASDASTVQLFDAATDAITFGETASARFDFQPQFVEQFAPFRFVYLQPEETS